MAVKHNRVTVGATAVPLLAPDTDAVPGSWVFLHNSAATAVCIGGPGVTTSTGFEIPGGVTTHPIRLGHADNLYAVAMVAGSVVSVLQTGA